VVRSEGLRVQNELTPEQAALGTSAGRAAQRFGLSKVRVLSDVTVDGHRSVKVEFFR